MKTADKEMLGVRLDPKIKQKFKIKCAEERKSAAQYIEELIIKEIA